jgi:glycosidase
MKRFQGQGDPPLRSGIILQPYMPRFRGGIPAILENVDVLQRMHIEALFKGPDKRYCRECEDGPYSQLIDPRQRHQEIDPEHGGAAVIRALNESLRNAGIDPGADELVNHVDLHSPLVQDALHHPDERVRREAQSYLRLFDDPIAAGFADQDGRPKKINNNGLDPYRFYPEFGKYQSFTFMSGEQFDLDASNPRVREFNANQIRDDSELGSLIFRLDATHYSGGRVIVTRYGVNEPDGLEQVGYLRGVTDTMPGAWIVVEVGATRKGAAPWLKGHRAHANYDFGGFTTNVHDAHVGSWKLSRLNVEDSPEIDEDSFWLLMPGGAHDEVQGRYNPEEIWNLLVRDLGGIDGEFLVFDGKGLNQLTHNLLSPEQQRTIHAVNYGLPGKVVVYLPELMQLQSDIYAPERWPRRPWVSLPAILAQLNDPRSALNWHVRFFKLRESKEELQPNAPYIGHTSTNEAIWPYARTLGQEDKEARPGDLIFVSNADHASGQGTKTDWRRYAGKRLRRLVTDGDAYLDGDPGLKWVDASFVPTSTARHHEIELDKGETAVFEVCE